MKTLVLGCKGQLGQALAAAVPDGVALAEFDRSELDISDAAAVLAVVRVSKPEVIINAAAYTAVDKAESEIDLAEATNIDGPRNLAIAASEVDARLIHISTDFVFEGNASTPYKPDAPTKPQNVYGRTKREGELAVLEAMPNTATVVRTAWLYSRAGGNFVKTMLRLMQERNGLSVVADQVGTPTWAQSLATVVWALAGETGSSGIFHWSDGGTASWHEFAVAIQQESLSLKLLDRAIPIHAIATEDYPTAAVRPRYSVLDCSTTKDLLNVNPVEWRVNLHQMLKGFSTA